MTDELETIYQDLKMYEQLVEEKKKEFNALAKAYTEKGITQTESGKKISMRTRSNAKVDVLMLKTQHPDLYKKIIEEQDVPIPIKALDSYKSECPECIVEGEATIYFVLK